MKNLQKFTIALLLLSSISLLAQRNSFQDLVGVKGSSAEYILKDKGYVHIKSQKFNNHIYANWWNQTLKDCITTEISDGRINSIKKTSASNCVKGSNEDNWNNQSNNNINNNDNNWNNQSNNNNSNNSALVEVTDLMKVSAPLAYDQLKERGFTYVKGGGKYKIWYNEKTKQCIKTVSIQKHIHDIIKSTHCKD